MLFVIMTVFIIIIKFFLFSFFWSIVIFELAPLLVSFNFGATTFQLFHPFCIAFIIRHTWFAVYEPCCSLEVPSNVPLFHVLSLSLSCFSALYDLSIIYSFTLSYNMLRYVDHSIHAHTFINVIATIFILLRIVLHILEGRNLHSNIKSIFW